MLSEFQQPVLPLPCNVYISVTSLQLDHHVNDMSVRQWLIHVHEYVKAKGGHLSSS